MRYQVYMSDNGKFFILDDIKGTVVCYCGSESLAESTVQKLNQTLDRPRGQLHDSTKIH